MKGSVKFKKKDVKAHIDERIRNWRERIVDEQKRKNPDSLFPKMESTRELKAQCYLDAFQSLRFALFGEKLPEE